MSALEKKLEDEKREREKVEQEKKRVVQDYERSQMERAQERAMTTSLRENYDLLKQEVQQYRQNVTSLQERLNRVSKDFHMDMKDLSEVLMLIKAFRLHHESCESLMGLVNNEKIKDPSQDLAVLQASHAETILELQKTRELLGYSLKVEILSLLFDPSSSVALDQSVQQVYVEYRLLGIPMETTETPMSLQKPKEGEEIHFNFSRVIHVDSMEAAPLRQYLYTILESTDPKYGRSNVVNLDS
ncbi:protein fantom-like [Clarias magur]|uniref:Protein fantom-like n=1 Tax=Clarias magur TaxID=1594786 RepID=A0A8J4TYZ8_CLAMG|nr:protein fantom-like [Clarias magur]